MMLSSFTWKSHSPRSATAITSPPAAGTAPHASPRKRVSPVSGLSLVTGRVSLPWIAVNSLPAAGPPWKVAVTR
jgi:hypothetical protein